MKAAAGGVSGAPGGGRGRLQIYARRKRERQPADLIIDEKGPGEQAYNASSRALFVILKVKRRSAFYLI